MAGTNAKQIADDLLNWYKGTAFPAAPTTVYLGLLTTLPTHNDGTGLVEASGTAYAREAIAFGAISTQGDNQTEQMSNSGAITFPAVGSGAWGTIVGAVLTTAPSAAIAAANLLDWGSLTTGNIVTSVGNVISFPAGNATKTQS